MTAAVYTFAISGVGIVVLLALKFMEVRRGSLPFLNVYNRALAPVAVWCSEKAVTLKHFIISHLNLWRVLHFIRKQVAILILRVHRMSSRFTFHAAERLNGRPKRTSTNPVSSFLRHVLDFKKELPRNGDYPDPGLGR